jgi:hypothetical protein
VNFGVVLMVSLCGKAVADPVMRHFKNPSKAIIAIMPQLAMNASLGETTPRSSIDPADIDNIGIVDKNTPKERTEKTIAFGFVSLRTCWSSPPRVPPMSHNDRIAFRANIRSFTF